MRPDARRFENWEFNYAAVIGLGAAAEQVRAFGIEPKIALLSRSNFGTHEELPSAVKMRAALALIHAHDPDLEVDGEMHGDAALSADIRARIYSHSRLTGRANLLILPSVDAAHIAYSLLKELGSGVYLGPILMGARHPAHVLPQSVTVRGLLNMAVLAVNQVLVAEAAAEGD